MVSQHTDAAARTIFISCGQSPGEERDLGEQVRLLVDKLTPFRGYFAQNQTSLSALSQNVLSKLYGSVGLIAIMHHRGRIEERDTIRGSVWVEQEIAIATFMQQILHRPLHVALFVQRGIAIEGIRQQIQLNPIEFSSAADVVGRLEEILPDWNEALYVGDEERQRTVDSVSLRIHIDNGHVANFTAAFQNYSHVDVEVVEGGLWNFAKRISGPVTARPGVRWIIPAGRTISIYFEGQESITNRLGSMYPPSPREDFLNRRFIADLTLKVKCKILGLERIFEETTAVQVDLRGSQFTGL